MLWGPFSGPFYNGIELLPRTAALTSPPSAAYQQQQPAIPYNPQQQLQQLPMQQQYQVYPPIQNGAIPHQLQQQQQYLTPYGQLAPPVFPAASNGYATAIPTGHLVDISAAAAAEAEKRNSLVSSTSTNSTLTGDGGPIPLTVKNLEEEHRRKSGVGSWDYVYRQLENIGYTKDQVRLVLRFLNNKC